MNDIVRTLYYNTYNDKEAEHNHLYEEWILGSKYVMYGNFLIKKLFNEVGYKIVPAVYGFKHDE